MAANRGSTVAALFMVVRAASALVLVFLGGLFAFGCYVEVHWQNSPWPGQNGSTLGAILFGLLGLVTLSVPMAAWWFLLPRVRWWGIPVTVVFAVATIAAFTSNL